MDSNDVNTYLPRAVAATAKELFDRRPIFGMRPIRCNVFEWMCRHAVEAFRLRADPKRYDVAYHGTEWRTAKAVFGKRTKLAIPRVTSSEHLLFGPGVYLAPFRKAVRFAACDGTLRMNSRRHGGVLKVLLASLQPCSARGYMHIQEPLKETVLDHTVPKSFCKCARCQSKHAHKQADHDATWSKRADVLHVLPSHHGVVSTKETVVAREDILHVAGVLGPLTTYVETSVPTPYDCPITQWTDATQMK